MKYNKKLILFAAVCFAVTACKKDFLTQTDPNAVAVKDYYKTEAQMQNAVNGIYQSLYSSNTFGENSGLFTDERSDDMGRNDNQSNAGEPFQFNDFSLVPSNTYLKSHWSAMYNAISRCNEVLGNIDKPAYTTADAKAKFTAEAKFFRGLYLFQLVREFGDIPFSTVALHGKGETEEAAYRQKQSVVYNQIVQDLTDAVNSPLPNLQSQVAIGKVSKSAVLATLGKVYLTMAQTLTDVNRADMLAKAKDALLKCYQMKAFGNLADVPYADVFDVNKKLTCPELIWQLPYKQGDKQYSSSIAANNQAKGETINSLMPSTGAGTNIKLDVVNEYEDGDVRKAFSVKYANDATVRDWFITKFRDASSAAGVNGYGGNDWILIRYADVILMLAEVSNYMGNTTEAIQYLDMVRSRAKLPAYQASLGNAKYVAVAPNLKLAILHERRAELAFEHHRWFDLLRTFNNAELVAYFKAKKQSEYGTAKISNFSEKDRYYPIPFDEVKLNPQKMYQNPGY